MIRGQSGWILPSEGRHITILDIIPHSSDQRTRDEFNHNPNYVLAIQKAFDEPLEPIDVEFRGIFASPDGITLQGFPHGNALEVLRKRLRQAISEADLPNAEFNKYLLQTAHVSLIKFTNDLNGNKLLTLVDTLRNLPLGIITLADFVLGISSQFDKLQTIEILERFTSKTNSS